MNDELMLLKEQIDSYNNIDLFFKMISFQKSDSYDGDFTIKQQWAKQYSIYTYLTKINF